MTPVRLLLLLGFLAFTDPAFALRCGGKLVRDGDPMAKVLKYCGEPAGIQQRLIYRSGIPRTLSREDTAVSRRTSGNDELLIHRRSVVEVLVEEWTYNFGPRRLMRIVRFENGLVAEVKQLGYGYRD